MEVRHERPDDARAIADVHRQAFGEHAAVVEALVTDLRRLKGLSLVVERSGGASGFHERGPDVVGHVMFTPGWLDAPPRLVDVQILSPVAVKPDEQRRGIATALIREGLEVLRVRGAAAVFLEGDPRFYSRLGFVAAGSLGFRRPSLRIPDAAFQVMTLPAYEPWMTGTLVYPDAFWRHDAVGLRGSGDEE